MLKRTFWAWTALTGLGAAAALAGDIPLTTVQVATGLARPVFVTAPPGDLNRAFIVEQRSGTTGRVRILNLPDNTLNATPYLSVSPVSTGNEEGLLGLAFHPDFLNNGYFWVYYTTGGNNRIARYRANAPFDSSTTADAGSATTLLTINHPTFTNHNGGWIAFGPDGYLYVGTGDGGSGNDPPNNAQNPNVLLGKMLRLDVDGADDVPGNDDDDGVIGMTLPPYTSPPDNPFVGAAGMDEIWSIGLRNPWRNSFDRDTGDLYIADVGQNAIEEINFEKNGVAPTPVRNYGWRCMEGNNCTGLSGCTCNHPSLTLPIHTYSHSGGHCSISGGYVYRGCAMPEMHGIYFFADYCSARIWSFRFEGDALMEFTDRTTELAPGGGLVLNQITSFGEDAYGEIYICDQGGQVYKIVSADPLPDCDEDGVPDACETDSDGDGTPDDCETCPGDVNGDNEVDVTDLGTLLGNFGMTEAELSDGDLNGDGEVNVTDLGILLGNFGASC